VQFVQKCNKKAALFDRFLAKTPKSAYYATNNYNNFKTICQAGENVLDISFLCIFVLLVILHKQSFLILCKLQFLSHIFLLIINNFSDGSGQFTINFHFAFVQNDNILIYSNK